MSLFDVADPTHPLSLAVPRRDYMVTGLGFNYAAPTFLVTEPL